MAPHSSILSWSIPWTEESGGYSPWGHKESDMTETEHACMHTLQPWPDVCQVIFTPDDSAHSLLPCPLLQSCHLF